MSTESSETAAAPVAGAEKEESGRFKRLAAIALAILLFAFFLVLHLYRNGASASMIFFIVVPAIVLFLVMAPR
jgi:hypothetical protein